MTEYLLKASSIWFIGFFPFAEIYAAIAAGFAMKLDPVSIVVWSVTGNYVPAVGLAVGYDRLKHNPRVNRWIQKLVSEKAKRRMERYGVWGTLLLTPWIGVWAVAVTVKFFGMDTRQFLVTSFISILVYAMVITFGVHAGISFLGK